MGCWRVGCSPCSVVPLIESHIASSKIGDKQNTENTQDSLAPEDYASGRKQDVDRESTRNDPVGVALDMEKDEETPPAEDAVALPACLSGWVGSRLCTLLLGKFLDKLFQQTKEVAENGSGVSTSPPSQ